MLQKLLAALNECTEWGQVFILDALSKYTAANEKEAESIVERITPRLQHANSAVVLSAIRIILKYVHHHLVVTHSLSESNIQNNPIETWNRSKIKIPCAICPEKWPRPS